ncbi:serine proteinase stubble-like isoform X2 [Odontomachus brunneus]|uniref:serine proteinase stubble-like isoform X2 n=1 Tax=Odontomachus brunneus TaxID=486640 RepID=UPI0013F1ED83|nr:serine proteinase stubble-like isoform X2 [Odontomachus brunneus]
MCDRRKQAWAAVFIGNVLIHTAVIASPIYVPQFQPGTGTGRNIRHLPCVSRRSGETGVCMFAFTCAKANGTHLGTCIDRFYFGSCCKIDDEPDIYPQDNSIDDGPSPPRPSFITTHGPIESNDIPEYFARPKPTVEKNGAGSQATTTSVSSSTPQASTNTLRDTTKFVTRKPTITTIETTTQTTRLSTFQTVQSAPEGASSTEATLSKSTVGTIGTVNNRPSSVSSSTTRRPTKPSTTSSSLRPSTENTTKQSVTAAASKATTKRPIPTTTVQRPTHTSPKPSSPTTRRPVQSTTKTEPATTQKTVSLTRFPPRNSTSPQPLTQATTRKPVSTTKRPPAIATNTITTVLLPAVTKRPVATTKKPTTLTKRPSSSSKPSVNFSLDTTLAATTRPHTTSGSLSVGPSSASITGSTLTFTESRPSAVGTTTASTTSQKITATNTVITTKSPDQKPSTTRTTTTPRTTPKTTTKTSTIRTTTTRPTTTRPTTTRPTTIRTTTTRPTTTRPTTTRLTTTVKTTIDSKTTTPKPLPLTTAYVKPTKITTTTTKTTKPNEYASTATTTERTRLPLPSTVGSTVGVTRPKPTTMKPTKPLTKLPATTSSIAEITTVGSSSLSTFTVKDETASTNIPPTKGQDVNNTLEEIPLTTYSPGLVTWSSNSDEVSTRAPETSTSTSSSAPPTTTTTSTPPEHTETDWSPITTLDDWIMIQLPTEKLPQTPESTTEPVTEPTMQSLTSAKPITESTTISDYVTKKPMTLTTLSTIASVTINTELPITKETFNMSNYKEVCGRRLFPESRIVGGSQSSFGKWPWQISLRQWRQSTYLHKCGAALLNQNWAITAAHCVDSVPPSELLLRIGEYDLAKEEEPYGYQERRVQIVASHPQFDSRTFEYDLALLRFPEPILPFQPNILPICLPDDDETYVGRTAYVTGWGRLHDDGPLPSILQEVAVPVVNNTVCEDMYRTAGYVEHIPHIFICAGWRNGGYDSCEGDSGGPMVIQRARDKRWILAGIISWGIGCAVPNQPGVYTRISEFREWINQILQF